MASNTIDESTPVDEAVETTGGSGLDPNLAGALSYLLGALTGVIFFVVEKDDDFVRFHAAQSIVLSVALFVLGTVVSVLWTIMFGLAFAGGVGTGSFGLFAVVSLLFSLVWLAFGLGTFVAWLYLMYSAYRGNSPHIPVVGGYAERLAGN